MCFYHSVAIKIGIDDLLDILGLRPAYTMQYCKQDILQCIACNTLQGILHVAMLHSRQRAILQDNLAQSCTVN